MSREILSMANYKFIINTITKRPLQQLLTWEIANVKRCIKTSPRTGFRQLSNSPWTGIIDGIGVFERAWKCSEESTQGNQRWLGVALEPLLALGGSATMVGVTPRELSGRVFGPYDLKRRWSF